MRAFRPYVNVSSALSIFGTPVLSGTVGIAITPFSVFASGGTQPYTFSLAPSSGSLPAGIVLHSNGVTDGTPTTQGDYAGIVYRVTDFVGAHADLTPAFTMSIASASIAVSPNPITAPPTVTGWWGMARVTGYSGPCLRAYRVSDGAEMDIGWDVNQMVDVQALLDFSQGSDVLRKISYAQIGGVDSIQNTPSLMPYLVKSGAMVTNASGLPAARGAMEGRYSLAAGAWTPLQGQDFSLTTVSQNNAPQIVPTTNIYTPIMGVSTSAGLSTQRAQFLFGARSSANNRNSVLDFASAVSGTNEVVGSPGQVLYQYTTCIITTNTQAGALADGPGAGSTYWCNRGFGTTVDVAAHSPATFTTATDLREFAIWQTSWTTNSTNGADCNTTLNVIGRAMTNTQRNALEGALYDKFAAVLGQPYALPNLGINGEAWPFSTYASNTVSGVKGNATLQFETAANGSTFAPTTAPNGIVGLGATGTANFHNDYQGPSGFALDQEFTMYAVVTATDFEGSALLPDFMVRGIGTLGTNVSRYVSALVGKDHSELVSYTLDDTNGIFSDWTNMMEGDALCGKAAWLPYSPFMKGAFLGVNVPAHDNNSDHPTFYTKKRFLGKLQTSDKRNILTKNGITYMLMVKHKPHPLYRYSEPYNSPWNVLWRNKATVVVKAAFVGQLDGFARIPGGVTQMIGTAAHAVPNSNDRIRAYGGENLSTFAGVYHSTGWIAKFTTDDEDQALFYKAALNASALAS
jgi:hypothetical protein